MPKHWFERIYNPVVNGVVLERSASRRLITVEPDLFHVRIPEWFVDSVMDEARKHPEDVFALWTHDAQRLRAYVHNKRAMAWRESHGYIPLPNVWLGAKANTPAGLVHTAEIMQDTPATVRFIYVNGWEGPANPWEAVFAAMTYPKVEDFAEEEPSRFVSNKCWLDWLLINEERVDEPVVEVLTDVATSRGVPVMLTGACRGEWPNGWVPPLRQEITEEVEEDYDGMDKL